VKKPSLEFHIYILTMCFVMTIIGVVTLTVMLYDVVRMSAPEITLSGEQFEKYQTNQAFWDVCRLDRLCADDGEEMPEEAMLSELRKEWFERVLSSEGHRGMRHFVLMLIALVLEILTGVGHWLLWRYMNRDDDVVAEDAGDAKAAKA